MPMLDNERTFKSWQADASLVVVRTIDASGIIRTVKPLACINLAVGSGKELWTDAGVGAQGGRVEAGATVLAGV